MKSNNDNNLNSPSFVKGRTLVLEPKPGCPWASEMVLNPAILEDPSDGTIHMLFRATGPFEEKRTPGKPSPFPIFLGYAESRDRGKGWRIDFSRPALAPTLATDPAEIYIKNAWGQQVVNHANGCVEDPRWFWLDGENYLIAACRMFPPGPYWVKDEPTQCAPDWIKTAANPFGIAASQNVTVNVLFKVLPEALRSKDYEHAFQYCTHLTDPGRGENRDVILFPEKLTINGEQQYVMMHRPWQPAVYENVKQNLPPSMMMCAAKDLSQLWSETRTQTVLASPKFVWEKDRIGASAPLLKLTANEWLLCFHGKQDTEHGYSQSFMILENQPDGFPRIKHRCSKRVLYPVEQWEMPGRFKAPVVFITGMIKVDGNLMVSYGAADQRVGVAELDLPALVDYVRTFDTEGNQK